MRACLTEFLLWKQTCRAKTHQFATKGIIRKWGRGRSGEPERKLVAWPSKKMTQMVITTFTVETLDVVVAKSFGYNLKKKINPAKQ